MATIMGLLNQISDEEIVLPAIQRDFVWTEAQTETLLDSIMRDRICFRGLPLGYRRARDLHGEVSVGSHRDG